MKPITTEQLFRWVPHATLKTSGHLPLKHVRGYGVNTDTRSLSAGNVFVALKGERFDGHRFLAQAQRQKASLIVAAFDAPELQGANLDVPVLLVPHTGKALQDIAAGYRQQFQIPLAVVVGSNGKTTAKEMVHTIFKAHCTAMGNDRAAHCTVGNFNNEIGLPLTLLRLNEHYQYSVVELGMNHPGETVVLGKIAAPTIALINNAQREHQEFMHTVEAVAHEHAAVITALSQDGIVVLPAQDDYAYVWRDLAAARKKRVTDFALHTEDDQTPASVTGQRTDLGLSQTLTIQTPIGDARLTLQTAGEHNARNALAAVAVAIAANIPLSSIVTGLEAFEPVKGRMQQHTIQTNNGACVVIDDSYNANPDSVTAAIHVLSQQGSNTSLVLGDMGEVGDQGEAFHREVGALAAAQNIGALYTAGALSQYAHQAFQGCARPCQHFAETAALNQFLSSEAFNKTGTILVKGSRFMRMEWSVDTLLGRTTQAIGEH